MKARPGLTLIELMLAGAILGMLAFGSIWGIMHISRFVERRGELMAADGFCWDVAWAIFNSDYDLLNAYMVNEVPEEGKLARPEFGPAYLEIKGVLRKKNTGNWTSNYDFLSQLPAYEANPPVCYIILSNRCESGMFRDDEGVFINVNLEWGPKGQRRFLMPRPETTKDDIDGHRVFNHSVSLFRSKLSRSPFKE